MSVLSRTVRQEMDSEIRNMLETYRTELDEFQGLLNEGRILKVWSYFRESEGKREDGSIKRDVYHQGMNEGFNDRQFWSKEVAAKIFDLIFERFNYRKNSTIDIYDFLVSMAVCSRMSYDDKLQRSQATNLSHT